MKTFLSVLAALFLCWAIVIITSSCDKAESSTAQNETETPTDPTTTSTTVPPAGNNYTTAVPDNLKTVRLSLITNLN
jgi:hypothetical protein